MNIEIKSEFQYVENVYDAAFGLAKSLILNEKKAGVRRKGGFVMTASNKRNSVIVTIHSSPGLGI